MKHAKKQFYFLLGQEALDFNCFASNDFVIYSDRQNDYGQNNYRFA